MRETVAIHWNWTTEATNEEIAKALGVTASTVERYLRSEPSKEAQAQLEGIQAEVRMVAVQELREQLQAAGQRSKTAEAPAKVWTDDDGNLNVREMTDEDGEVVKRVPVPEDLELLPDEEARYYAREEVREILDQLCELVGAKEPEEHRVEHEGPAIVIDMGDE